MCIALMEAMKNGKLVKGEYNMLELKDKFNGDRSNPLLLSPLPIMEILFFSSFCIWSDINDML